MPIPFTCPHCGTQTYVAERYAGQTGPCASCGREIAVPDVSPDRSAYGQHVPETMWPRVIGILSIVLGSMGLFSMLTTLANPFVWEVFKKLPSWYSTFTVVSMPVGAAVTALLLAGGVLLYKRRPASRRLLLTYSALTIVQVLVGLVCVFLLDTSGLPTAMRIPFWIGSVVSMPLGMAYPLFLIVWFFRRKIRDEVEGWGEGITGS